MLSSVCIFIGSTTETKNMQDTLRYKLSAKTIWPICKAKESQTASRDIKIEGAQPGAKSSPISQSVSPYSGIFSYEYGWLVF